MGHFWHQPVLGPAPKAVAKPVDPFYVWAESSLWRGLRRHAGAPPTELRFIVQLRPTQRQVLQRKFPQARTPCWYAGESILPVSLPFGQRAAFVAWLMGQGCRWELAIPFRSAERAAAASPLGRYASDRNARSFANAPLKHLPKASAPAWARQQGAIAVIDDA